MKLTKLLNTCVYTIKLNFIVLFTSSFSLVNAQSIPQFTLDSLQSMARQRYPYAKQLILSGQYASESVKEVNAGWLPQFSISGKTTVQTEVTAISLPQSIANMGISFNKGEKYQYQGELSLTQLIYDGGISKTSKEINQLSADIQTGNVQISLLQLESVVNSLFESILINKLQLSMLDFNGTDLEARQKDLTVTTQNGTTLLSVLKELEAEQLSLDQKKIETKALLISLYSQLSFFVREKIDTSAILQNPNFKNENSINFNNIPEYLQFERQLKIKDNQLSLLKKEERPQLFFFANGYYGLPGLNAMDYNTHFSGITGLNLKWNIGTVYSNKHQKKGLMIQQEILKNQQSVFEIETQKKISLLNTDIEKNKLLIEKDNEVIKMRSEVKAEASVQLTNGSITLTDYIQKLNAVSQGIINRDIHKIEWQMDVAKLRTLLNQNHY